MSKTTINMFALLAGVATFLFVLFLFWYSGKDLLIRSHSNAASLVVAVVLSGCAFELTRIVLDQEQKQ